MPGLWYFQSCAKCSSMFFTVLLKRTKVDVWALIRFHEFLWALVAKSFCGFPVSFHFT